jgi:hypothetical protein
MQAAVEHFNEKVAAAPRRGTQRLRRELLSNGVFLCTAMGLTVTGLKRAYNVRQWRHIIGSNPYIAVLQLTGGRSWGRTNMKARVLGDLGGEPERVDAKYAVPWAARAGAEQTRFVGLAGLFRSAPCAVVYGPDVGAVLAVVERARGVLDGAILVGGRFGDAVVGSRSWDTALSLGGEEGVRLELVQVLGAPPQLIPVLESGSRDLVKTTVSGGAGLLTGVLQQRYRQVSDESSVTLKDEKEISGSS